jgi:hypothetical protein
MLCGCHCVTLQREQSLSAAWASVGAGEGSKRLENVTAPTNQLMAAECDEDCLWNNRNVLNGTAMDAGGSWCLVQMCGCEWRRRKGKGIGLRMSRRMPVECQERAQWYSYECSWVGVPGSRGGGGAR